MKPKIVRLAIALITFLIGIGLFSITESWWSRVSPLPPTLKVTHQITVRPPPQREESPLPPAGNIPKGTDLSIVVELGGRPPSFNVRHIKLGKKRQTTIALDLVESVDGQMVTLHLPASRSSYRMLQRYRTSMTISVEGPHLDLLDWRHYDSPWIPLEFLSTNRFRTLRSEQMDSSRFPKTTKAEIRKEVHRRIKNDWPELTESVESCNGPDNGACIVTISSIYLRIQKQVNDRWMDVGVVEIAIPMGC